MLRDSRKAVPTRSLNQAWMPKLKKRAENTATMIAGVTASRPNNSTSRAWRRDPALPLRRSTQRRTSLCATSIINGSSSAMSTMMRVSKVCGSGPNGGEPVSAI